jgi:predicted metal-binding protein
VNYQIDVSEISTERLLAYQEQAYFEKLCAQCPNYAVNHGCPPFEFMPRDYIAQFRFINIVRVKADTGPLLDKYPARDESNPVNQAQQLIRLIRGGIDGVLMSMEQAFGGARVSLPGACNICATCARKAGLPCELGQPRYSLEALGINLARLTKDLFKEEILWIRNGKLPAYFSLLSGIFSDIDGRQQEIHSRLQKSE